MKRVSLDKSSILLIAIAVILISTLVYFVAALRSDALSQVVKSDRIINLCFILEREGKPVSTQVFMFYPASGMGALLDVPGDTGLLIKSLDRVTRIDTLYDKRRPKPYIKEISTLLATEISFFIILDEHSLQALVDVLEGVELFVPAPVVLKGPPSALLPPGASLFDGTKASQYAYYIDPEETDADAATRRQKLIQSLIRRLGTQSDRLFASASLSSLKKNLRTDLSDESLQNLITLFARIDADRLLFQRINGTYKNVDGSRLLFPLYDGELIRDLVKQTLNALSNTASGTAADKIFTIEILNGTTVQGLAKRAAEIFQSFGYDVINIGNADRDDYAETKVLDRFSNTNAASNIAGVIRCSSIEQEPPASAENSADFTILLGKDFNGRYCIR
jgi:anionic cell wall polymer biosynthesis LytR-Cps2A-Psr (LCP) family protein